MTEARSAMRERIPGRRRRVCAGARAGVALTLALLAVPLLLAACTSDDGGDDPTVALAPTATATVTAFAPVDDRVPGVSAGRVHFGQSADFSGTAAALGRNMRIGIQAAFNEVNDQGGISGRRLELSSRDDLYTPADAALNTIKLINEDQVFALIGGVGTPTSRSAVPVSEGAGVPYIAPFTGASFLRDTSTLHHVINLRASYAQEAEEMVERLTSDLGITRIAIFYQDDSFGRAGLQGVTNALEKRDMELASIGVYPRLTTAVKGALLDIQRGDPQAVIIIGAYAPTATLISWARKLEFNPVFIAVSFVGSNALAEALGPDGRNVFITQVVPFPTDDSLPITADYLTALRRYYPGSSPGFVSFEGYLAGRMAIEGLRRCGEDLTRDCFTRSLRNGDPIDLGGFTIQFGEDDNQGSDRIFTTRIDDQGDFQPVNNLRDAFVN